MYFKKVFDTEIRVPYMQTTDGAAASCGRVVLRQADANDRTSYLLKSRGEVLVVF